MDVDIDLVQGFNTSARFYRDSSGRDYVEIAFIGNPDTLIKKVTPEIMARYRDQWNAYCDGVPMKQRNGTPLTTLKEISEEKAAEFVRRNLHTLEELAALNDHQCQGLGHGTMTLRKLAQAFVSRKAFEEKEEAHKKITVAPIAAVSPAETSHPEMQALQDIVAQQGEAISKIGSTLEQLTALLAKQAVTSKKKKHGPKQHSGNNEPSV